MLEYLELFFNRSVILMLLSELISKLALFVFCCRGWH